MGLYIAFTPDIYCRKSSCVFFVEDDICYLKSGRRRKISLFGLGKDHLQAFKDIIDYALSNKIDSFETLLFNSSYLKELICYLSNYLLDKDLSIGLLTTDRFLIDENEELLKKYGVTCSNPNLFNEYKALSIHPSFKAEMSGAFDECEVNGMPEEPVCAGVVRHPRPRLRQKSKPLKQNLIVLDESFHDKFLKLLIESGKENVEIYKKAGITRQVFSKILSDKDMIPSKLTLVSLCIGLELSLQVAKELMVSAGYSLSRSLMFDSIVMKYLREEIYDFELINSELDEYGCQLLGWHPRDN